MQCTFKDSTNIKKIITALEHGVENLILYVSKQGINVAATNASHTDMRELVLTPNYFESFKCDEEEAIQLGINMGLFKKFINTASSSDKITWKADVKNAHFDIEIASIGENKTVKNWTLKLIDIDTEALSPPPNPAFDVGMRISSLLVTDWIANCKLLNGNVTIGIEKNTCITVDCEADEGSLSLKQSLPSVMATIFHTSPEFSKLKLTISSKEAEYLNTMIKCAPGIDIELNSQMPLCATSYLNTEQTSYIRLWIAPVASDDDDI